MDRKSEKNEEKESVRENKGHKDVHDILKGQSKKQWSGCISERL